MNKKTRIQNLVTRLDKLKEKVREARKPDTRVMAKNRQQKFIRNMQDAGKKRVGFFLSDAAVTAIKSYRVEKNFRSLNQALEFMLSGSEVEPVEAAATEKVVTVYEPTAEQKLILEQAKIVAGAYRDWKQSPNNETAPALAREAEILAGLF